MNPKKDWKSIEFLKGISNRTVAVITSFIAFFLLYFMMTYGGVKP